MGAGDSENRAIIVRPYRPGDRAAMLALAPRLTIGMPSWRDPQGCHAAVLGWVESSLERPDLAGAVFVAEDESGAPVGFATVTHETHWSGERQASLGELAVDPAAEGRGVGQALVQACERWAREQGYHALALATGAANLRALGFYHRLGYQDEDVKLVKLLDEPGG